MKTPTWLFLCFCFGHSQPPSPRRSHSRSRCYFPWRKIQLWSQTAESDSHVREKCTIIVQIPTCFTMWNECLTDNDRYYLCRFPWQEFLFWSVPQFPAASPPQCWQCIWCLRKRWPSRNEVTSADSKFFGIWRTVRTRCYFSQIAEKISTVFPPFFSIFALTPVISGHCPHLSHENNQGCNPLFPIFSPFFPLFCSSLRLCQLLGAPSCGPKSVDHGGQGQAQRHLRRRVWTRVLTWRETSRKQDRFR